METVAGETDVTQLVVGDLLFGRVVGGVERGVDAQASPGGGVLDQVHHHLMAHQGTATPVLGDV